MTNDVIQRVAGRACSPASPSTVDGHGACVNVKTVLIHCCDGWCAAGLPRASKPALRTAVPYFVRQFSPNNTPRMLAARYKSAREAPWYLAFAKVVTR